MTFVQILAAFISDGAGVGGPEALAALLSVFASLGIAAVGFAAVKERAARRAAQAKPRQQATKV